MITLLDFVHRQKLLEPANPDFQIDITNARNVYRQNSFAIWSHAFWPITDQARSL